LTVVEIAEKLNANKNSIFTNIRRLRKCDFIKWRMRTTPKNCRPTLEYRRLK